MSLLLLYAGAGGKTGIARLGGIFIDNEEIEKIEHDDDIVLEMIKKFFAEGL